MLKTQFAVFARCSSVVISLLLVINVLIYLLAIELMHRSTSDFSYALIDDAPVFSSLDRFATLCNTTTECVADRCIWTSDNETTTTRIVDQMRYTRDYQADRTIKRILVIAHPNDGSPLPIGEKLFHQKGCPVRTCSLTTARREIGLADAVLFQTFTAEERNEFRVVRPADQIWIVVGRESPNINARLKIFDTPAMGNLINWTINYRLDATIPRPYGVFARFANYTGNIDDCTSTAAGVNYARGRTKKIAWFVSNCGDLVTSGRREYAEELGRYISVDVFGKCGDGYCSKSKWNDCVTMMRANYKFYLAFENSNCRGYITEKFHTNAIRYGIRTCPVQKHTNESYPVLLCRFIPII